VRVRGNVVEFASGSTTLTELASVTAVLVCSTGGSVTPTPVQLPVSSVGDWERYEGMLISLPQTMAVTETFTLGRFGEAGLALGSRLLNPTSVATPGAPALAVQDLNNRSRILLDDGNNQQNIDPTLYPAGGLSASNTLRSGDTVTGLAGVLDQRFSLYRIQPVGPVPFVATNPRPAAPASVEGGVKVASMNVLNFFNGDGLGGGFPTARGAETAFELQRQRDKIVSAILGMDADIVGLMEIENDAQPNSALAELTNALNAVAGAGTYAFIDTGVIGTDQIKVALVYQPANVTPEGSFALLTSAVDPLFIDTLNRPALAQTFSENANGQGFTVVVNHLKSKGSDCNAVGDPDTGDGQGNCNVTRTNAATALANWLASDPTGSGDDDMLIIGDLNAYAQEDPITALNAGGYTNLVETFLGQGAYSFVFDGQSGYLDHALANASLVPQITGVTEWHINADEPIALDYNVNFKTANHVNTLYAPTPFRSSDHDPVLVGVCQAPTLEMSVSPNVLRPPNHKYHTVTATPDASSDVTDIELLSVTSNEPDDGEDDGNTINDIVIVDDLSVRLRAERSGTGNGRIYTLTWEATNACGATITDTATVSVPRGG
jgi:predicted extracellular nuclease